MSDPGDLTGGVGVPPQSAQAPDAEAAWVADDRIGRPPLPLRILGVLAAAVLGIATFGALGLAAAQGLYDHGVIGHRGFDEMESLTYVLGGAAVGAAIGVVVAVWVGLRVWWGSWIPLLGLTVIAIATGATLAIAA